MDRNITIKALLAATTLIGGCGDTITEDFDQAEGGVPTHEGGDLEVAPGVDEEENDEEDDGLSHAPGQLTNPEPSEDPGGRITGMSEEDGDLIVHATVGDEVLALYPEADEYRIRFDLDGASDVLYTELVDVEGVVLERMRNRDVDSTYFAGERALQFCFPGPWIGIPQNCTVSPCPWETEPSPWNCFEVTGDGQTTRIRGELDEMPVGRDIYDLGEELEVVDVTGGTLTDAQSAHLQAMGVIMDDLSAVVPEVEPIGGECLGCIGSGIIGSKGAVHCVFGSIVGCGMAASSYWLWNNGCKSAC